MSLSPPRTRVYLIYISVSVSPSPLLAVVVVIYSYITTTPNLVSEDESNLLLCNLSLLVSLHLGWGLAGMIGLLPWHQADVLARAGGLFLR